MDFEEELKKFDIHWVAKEYPTFEEFMDWVDIDAGIEKEKMLNTYKNVAQQFRDGGYPVQADLIMLKYEKVKNEDIQKG